MHAKDKKHGQPQKQHVQTPKKERLDPSLKEGGCGVSSLNAYFAPRILALEEAAQAQYGVGYDRLMEDKNYDAIKNLNAQVPHRSLAITCIYNAQGTPIVVGSTPRGLPFNLINAPIGEPYVQACREARRP